MSRIGSTTWKEWLKPEFVKYFTSVNYTERRTMKKDPEETEAQFMS
jgi:hypothetical protein